MDLLSRDSEDWLTKLVLPCNEIKAIQSNGLLTLYIFSTPRATNNRSAQNSMYSHIRVEFIPINSTGNALDTKTFSMSTAFPMISWMRCWGSLFIKWSLYSKHAKSQCKPSSRLMSSLEKHKPGIKPRFFNQNTAQNDPEKKMPSHAAKATTLSANDAFSALVHRRHQSAF